MTPEVPGWTALSPAPPVMVRSGTDCFQIYRAASKGQGTRKGRETPWPFGEEPTLGQVASFVLTGEASEWSIKKAGVWWLTNRARDEGMSASLRAVVSPDYL